MPTLMRIPIKMHGLLLLISVALQGIADRQMYPKYPPDKGTNMEESEKRQIKVKEREWKKKMSNKKENDEKWSV